MNPQRAQDFIIGRRLVLRYLFATVFDAATLGFLAKEFIVGCFRPKWGFFDRAPGQIEIVIIINNQY
jgi:hypothetical protein